MKGKGKLFILAAAIAVLLCGSVMASEKVWQWKNQLTVKDENNALKITYSENTENKKDIQAEKGGTANKSGNKENNFGKAGIYKIKWIPEGYKKTDSHTDGTDSYFYTETFENENGDLILYGQYPENYEMNLSYDKSSGTQSTIDICGIEGTYISDEEGKTITYGADDVMYMIRGNVSKNKLVKMLESRVRAEE